MFRKNTQTSRGLLRVVSGRKRESAMSDSAGRYSIRVTDSNPQMLYALAEGFAVQRAIVKLVGAAGTVSFQLRPEFRIVGRVVDPDGAPVVGVVVTANADFAA